MKEVLSFFPGLLAVRFFLWPEHDGNAVPKIPEHVMIAHAKEWEVVCPELDSVTFLDRSTFYKGKRTNEWAQPVW